MDEENEPSPASSSTSTRTAFPLQVSSPHTAVGITTRLDAAKNKRAQKTSDHDEDTATRGDLSKAGDKSKKSGEAEQKGDGQNYVSDDFKQELVSRSSAISSAVTLSIQHVVSCEMRGELLRPISEESVAIVHDLLVSADTPKILKVLLSNWTFISCTDTDLTKLIVVSGSVRVFCLRSLMITNQLSDYIRDLKISVLCYSVKKEIFDTLFHQCKSLDRSRAELDGMPIEVPEAVAPLVSAMYTREWSSAEESAFSLFHSVSLIHSTVTAIYPEMVRREMSCRKVEQASQMLEETGIVPKKMRFSVELSFSEINTRQAMLGLARNNVRVHSSNKSCLTVVRASRVDDIATAAALQEYAKCSRLKKKCIGIAESKVEEEMSDVVREPASKKRKMTRKHGWKKSCDLLDTFLGNKKSWAEAYIPIIFEDAVDEIDEWLLMLPHCSAIVVVAGNVGKKYFGVSRFHDYPSMRHITIAKVGGQPKLVAVFSTSADFLKCELYNKNLEDLLKNECIAKNLTCVRPTSGPPKP